MTEDLSNPLPSHVFVRRSITVAAPPERAFSVFALEMGTWWPLASHHIGKVDAADVVIEPRVGGRYFERGVDGSECELGRVLVWDPPRRLVLAWEISCQWQHDGKVQSEVDVRFTAEGERTRVDLEHRHLETYGERAEEMKKVFETPGGGWSFVLGCFEKRASA